MLVQKVKIKIQNDLIDHLSASQSVNEDVRNNFNQSNQCFNALKCQKCAIKKIVYCVELFTFVFTKSFTKSFIKSFTKSFTNSFVNEDVRINFKQCFNALKCPKIVKNYYGAPPPPAAKLSIAEKSRSPKKLSKTRRRCRF